MPPRAGHLQGFMWLYKKFSFKKCPFLVNEKKSFARIYFTSLSFLCIECVCVCVSETERSDKNVWSGESKIFNISACIEINSASGILSSSSCYFRIHKNIERKIFSTKLVDIKTPSNERKCVSHNAMDDDEPL